MMNEEQFEAVMLDSSISIKLSEIDAVENNREFCVDDRGELYIKIFATQYLPSDYINIEFRVS